MVPVASRAMGFPGRGRESASGVDAGVVDFGRAGAAGPDRAAGRAPGYQLRERGPDLAAVGPATVKGRDVQVQHRPGAGGQDPRRCRDLPGSSRERGRGMHRREDPDPGPRPSDVRGTRFDGGTGPLAMTHPLAVGRSDAYARSAREEDQRSSSPVMNASSLARPSSSGRCTGGDFIR